MAQPNSFPAFLGIEYRETPDGFPAFTAAARGAFAKAEGEAQRFSVASAKVAEQVSRAITGIGNGAGRLDLDVPGLKAGALAAEAKARAARELYEATKAASLASTAHGEAARLELATIERVAGEFEHKAAAARQLVVAMEAVQRQVDATAGSSTRLAIQSRNAALAMQASGVSAGQLRAASVGVGQQMTDIAVSLQGGQRAATVFAQQIPQLAFALQGLEGSANKTLSRLGALGSFLSGPWGAALSIGAFAVVALADSMNKVDESSEAAQKASQDFRAGLLNVGDFADRTTGKMLTLASATLRAAQAMNALEGRKQANRTLDLQSRAFSAAMTYSREQGTKLSPGGPGQEYNKYRSDPDVIAAIRKAGGDPRKTSIEGNIFSLERELAAAAKRRPELRGLADEVSLLAAETVEAGKAMLKLREGMDFLSGKRDIVPDFRPPRAPKVRAAKAVKEEMDPLEESWATLQANLIDLQAKLRADLMGIGKDATSFLEREQAALEQVARLEAAAAEDARRRLDAYLGQLDAIGRMGGALGALSGVLGGLATGEFGGVPGKAGALLNLVSGSVGAEGWKQVTKKLDGIFGGTDGAFAKTMGRVLSGAATGSVAGSVALGGKGSSLGSAIGGALGKELGQKVLGKALGSFAGPLGSIAGGILGGMLGGLFKKTRIGYATIGADASGGLGITKSGGNSASRIQSGDRSANTVIDSIEEIAAQLGASVDASRGSVSIGMSGDSYHVDTTGQGRLKKSQGGKDFNQDAQAAVAYAIQDLIKDGVLVGLRQGTERLLKDAVDLSAGLSKALKFEGVFRDLKRLKDPVAAAIDDLKTEFDSLRNVFKDAGASTEEYAQLEELYQKRRKMAVEEATKALTGSLKDLLDQITIGDSGYSLRTRLENARAAYDPLAARVKAGDATAYDDYANAAQTLLDLQRQYSGSTEDYFTVLDQVKGLTKSEYDRQMSLIEATTAQTEAIVGAIVAQTSAQVAATVTAANDNATRLEARFAELLAAVKANGTIGGKMNF